MDYSSPPVREVAFGFEFDPSTALDGWRLITLQDTWGSDFPERRILPAKPRAVPLDFAVDPAPQDVDLPLLVWASNPASGLLLQSQRDRFFLNWRAVEPSSDYPGFLALMPTFTRRWAQVREHCLTAGSPPPSPSVAEFTYVNVLDGVDTARPTFSLTFHAEPSLPGRNTVANLQVHQELDEVGDGGSLTVNAFGGGDGAPLTLIICTRLRVGVGADPLARLAEAHAVSRQAFDHVTTAEAKREWGLR
ncbi:MAG: hypothetical protein QG597_2857 [Actinomycetota bacterium]|nr:hypothetical protein [Actinomycetota bacterium]